MFDLNPLVSWGLEQKDVAFAQLFLDFTAEAQIQAVQNFKQAAHFDLNTVKVVLPCGTSYTAAAA